MYDKGKIVTIIDTERKHFALSADLPWKGTKIVICAKQESSRELGLPGYYYLVKSLDGRTAWYLHDSNIKSNYRDKPTWL